MKSIVLVIKQSFLNSKSTLSSDVEAGTLQADSWLLPTGNEHQREQRKREKEEEISFFVSWLLLTLSPQQRPFIPTAASGFSKARLLQNQLRIALGGSCTNLAAFLLWRFEPQFQGAPTQHVRGTSCSLAWPFLRGTGPWSVRSLLQGFVSSNPIPVFPQPKSHSCLLLTQLLSRNYFSGLLFLNLKTPALTIPFNKFSLLKYLVWFHFSHWSPSERHTERVSEWWMDWHG